MMEVKRERKMKVFLRVMGKDEERAEHVRQALQN